MKIEIDVPEVVYFMPQGLVGLPQVLRSWYTARRKGERVAHAS